VAGGRSGCAAAEGGQKREYLVYYGGNPKNCAANATFLSRDGHFKPQRSRWELHVSAQSGTTPVVTAGRACPNGKNGLAGRAASADIGVVLAGTSHRWRVARVGGDCTLVNLVDAVRLQPSFDCWIAAFAHALVYEDLCLLDAVQTRDAAGAPAFLSSAQSCAHTAPLLVSKDYGTGRQRWRLVELE
jgi:hypothetical protein